MISQAGDNLNKVVLLWSVYEVVLLIPFFRNSLPATFNTAATAASMAEMVRCG
jgi:hypothetical protein